MLNGRKHRVELKKMTDLEIIQRVRNGDDSAFAALIRKYEQRVAATVIGMLGHGPEAEDTGQEVFIRFYKALPKFRGESSVATYLTRIAINLALTTLRRRKMRQLLFSGLDKKQENVLDPKSFLTAIEHRDAVHALLQKLPVKFRAVLVLRLLDDCSVDETAEILGIPAGTVLSRLARGLEKARKVLQENMEYES